MNELLLNCNMGGLFLTMGLPTLDPVMTSVLDYIHQHALFLGSWGGFAKSLGLILAMCVTSYECWMMMLGRRGIDVMKLLRIVGISLCIVSANAIADAVAAPGESMGRVMKAQAKISHDRIDALEKHEAKLQSQYLDKLRAHNDSLDRKRRAEAKLSEDSHWWEEVAYAVKNMDNAVEEWAKEAAVIAETKITETINTLIRYIGEIIYQVVYFGMLLGQAFMMNVLKIFCPVAFALSIVPPWGSAWSQWISKYVSLSLWAPLIYMCSIYADMILKYTILQDTTAYTTLLGSASYTWGEIGGLGMQGIGSTCMYVVGLLVGAMLLKFVPELASWIVPGGASSSIGSAVSGMTTTGAAAVGGTIGGIAGASIGVTRHTVGGTIKGGVEGAYNGSANGGGWSGAASGAWNGARSGGQRGFERGMDFNVGTHMRDKQYK